MIDWTKPIETVPCERNPQPVPCEVARVHLWRVELFIRGDWICTDGENLFDPPEEYFGWDYELDGIPYDDEMPRIRNVSPLTQG